MSDGDVAEWRQDLKTHWLMTEEDRERLRAGGREIIAAWDARQEAIKVVNDAHGVGDLDRQAAELSSEVYRVETAIFALPALTPEGWRVKARIITALIEGQDEGAYEDMVIRSLLADLLRRVA